MFYDKQSNNQVLRMQTMHTGMPIANEAEELKRFTGVEFAVVHAEPPSLFVIHKGERFSPEETRPMAAYFIMNNRIYQSPDVYHVLSNRLLTSLYSLQSSMDILRKYRPDYTPRSGWAWPIADTAAEDPNKKARAGSIAPAESQDIPETLAKAKASISTKHQNTALLLNAMRTTAVHSKKPLNVDVQQAVGPDSAATETPAGTVPRSSATPGPVSTPQPSVSGSQESIGKAAPGAAKKKRKRASIAAPPQTS
ncbi:hypothetical protein EWM64_g693 [Hericium alpestre]|uniref:Mediator of RNA polymerase II transcription subunit 6 n=1 Tax=Hericium alpestre TaxID=135208 RepID=A0A4Z0AAG0_9AGAM|nr:hypothetical protein EWM64_g693 [Hericium alpestre]